MPPVLTDADAVAEPIPAPLVPPPGSLVITFAFGLGAIVCTRAALSARILPPTPYSPTPDLTRYQVLRRVAVESPSGVERLYRCRPASTAGDVAAELVELAEIELVSEDEARAAHTPAS